jgi:hypothetical protein
MQLRQVEKFGSSTDAHGSPQTIVLPSEKFGKIKIASVESTGI